MSWQPLHCILPRPGRCSDSSDQSESGHVWLALLEAQEHVHATVLRSIIPRMRPALTSHFKMAPHTPVQNRIANFSTDQAIIDGLDRGFFCYGTNGGEITTPRSTVHAHACAKSSIFTVFAGKNNKNVSK